MTAFRLLWSTRTGRWASAAGIAAGSLAPFMEVGGVGAYASLLGICLLLGSLWLLSQQAETQAARIARFFSLSLLMTGGMMVSALVLAQLGVIGVPV